MRTLSPQTVSAYWDELEKIAADRALRNVRALVQAGNLDEADILARRYAQRGALKRTDAGSQLVPGRKPHGILGGGMEGPAVVTVGQHAGAGGVAVRKSFDPTGFLYSRPMVERKLEVGQALAKKNDPRFARLLSKEVGERGGAPFLHSEYVHQGESGTKAVEGLMQRSGTAFEQTQNKNLGFLARVKAGLDLARAQKNLASLISQTERLEASDPTGKFTLGDLSMNPGNYRVMPDGTPKAIDYLPFKPSELSDMQARAPIFALGGLGEDAAKRRQWGVVEGMNPQGRWRPADVTGTLQRLGPGSREAKKVRGSK